MTDRLAEIKQAHAQENQMVNDGEIDWLIAEVERLRIEVADLQQPGCARPWPANKEIRP